MRSKTKWLQKKIKMIRKFILTLNSTGSMRFKSFLVGFTIAGCDELAGAWRGGGGWLIDNFDWSLMLFVWWFVVYLLCVSLVFWFFRLKIFGFCQGNHEFRCRRRIVHVAKAIELFEHRYWAGNEDSLQDTRNDCFFDLYNRWSAMRIWKQCVKQDRQKQNDVAKDDPWIIVFHN